MSDDVVSARIAAQTQNLERINSWINNADAKVGAVLAFDVALLAYLGTLAGKVKAIANDEALSWEPIILYVALSLYGISLASALYFALRALFPDIRARAPSPFFFGSISRMDHQQFADQAKSLSPQGIEDALIEQVHTNSTIATAKFENLRIATYMSLAGLIFWVVSILLAFGL